MIYTCCGSLLILDMSWIVLILSRIGGIFHKFRIYSCAGFGVLIFRHAPAMESGRTSPGVFIADLVLAWLQNFIAHKLKAIASEYFHL